MVIFTFYVSLLFFNTLFTMLFRCIYYILSYTICLSSSIINLFLTFLFNLIQTGVSWKSILIFKRKKSNGLSRLFVRNQSFLASLLPILLTVTILYCFFLFSFLACFLTFILDSFLTCLLTYSTII